VDTFGLARRVSNVQHDAEGNVTGYDLGMPNLIRPPNNGAGNQISHDFKAYNIRDELTGETGLSPATTTPQTLSRIADVYGYACALSLSTNYPYCQSGVDPATGAFLGSPQKSSPCTTGYDSMAYDRAGRGISQTIAWSATSGCSGQVLVQTRGYDADNRTISDNCTGFNGICNFVQATYK
jgi:hypothetical protein